MKANRVLMVCDRLRAFFASDILKVLEVQVFLFPILVVVMATAAFLLGGGCSAWQWWVPCAITLLLPFFRYKNRTPIAADFMFLSLLACLWLTGPFIIDSAAGNVDYHFTSTRLMIAGWNPVNDPLAHKILASLGLPLKGMNYLHVAYIARVAEVFNAVAFFFVRDSFAISYPFLFFMNIALAIVAIRTFRHIHWILGLLVLWLAWHHYPDWEKYVDVGVMYASAMLVMVMYRCLRFRHVEWLCLGAPVFWMMNLKLPSLLVAFLMCLVFFIAVLCQIRGAARLLVFYRTLLLGVVLVSLFSIVSFSPYGTSWRDCGHPLYPFKTVDAGQFPVVNLTEDFQHGNADLALMGYWGQWLNAYTVPEWVGKYYGWKLNRSDFKPHRFSWGGGAEPATFPCCASDRVVLWLSFLALLLLPGWRLFSAMMISTLFMFPIEYAGYLRYFAWLNGFEIVAAVALAAFLFEHSRKIKVVGAVLLVLTGAALAIRYAVISNVFIFEMKRNLVPRSELAMIDAYSLNPDLNLYTDPSGKKIRFFDYYDLKIRYHNNGALMLRELGLDQSCRLTYITKSDLPRYREVYYGYYLPVGEYREPDFEQLRRKHLSLQLVELPKLILKTYFVDYPRALLSRI